jgi:DNA processing protein
MDRGLLDLIIGRIPGLSRAEGARLCVKFDREEELSVLSKHGLEEILGRNLRVPPLDMAALRAQAERDAVRARRQGIGYVSYVQAEYPPLLRELPDPPVVLFYRGILPDPGRPMAAVVGTRRPTGPGAAQAYDMARVLAQGGIAVVSGLALGIDAMAHRGNLEGGGATVAVLGSGLDEVYPSANRMLARRIIERGGVMVSEYPPGTGPRKWHFPARNRIIAGLARGTVLIEAPRPSGALITAQFALDQGRDLWIASAGIASPRGEGTRRLAEEGGRVIHDAGIILEEWGFCREKQYGDPIPVNGAALALSLAQTLNIEL